MNSEIEFSKKSFVSLTRKTIYISLITCLLVPVGVVASFGAMMGVRSIFVIGFLSAVLGSGGGWFLLQLWERKMQRSVSLLVQTRLERLQDLPEHVPFSQIQRYESEIQQLVNELEKTRTGYEHQISLMQSSVAKSKEEVAQLQFEMDKKLEQMRLAYLEFEDLRQEYRCLEEEGTQTRLEGKKNLEHKESLIAEYQRTIAEQRMILEKKQRYITHLEEKVRDQVFEIRSLLQLEAPIKHGPLEERLEVSEQERYSSISHVPRTPYDFSIQLHRYIEKAEHLTGVDHLGYVGGKSPRFLDPSLEGYAVDRRRLFDSFKDETGGIVFIYSLTEKKFLFVSPGVKGLTGWSQEKFMKEFPRLVIRGYPEWGEALGKIKAMKEFSLKLSVLNRANQPLAIDCYMGLIGKGPFAHHVVGILSSNNLTN